MRTANWLSAGALGAAAAYFFDPNSGKRRRALLIDAIEHARHEGPRRLIGAFNDLEHRAHGTLSRARAVATAGEADDQTIVARVRSRLGRVSGSIHGICATSNHGVVELTGHVLEDEVGSVLHTARSTRGVRRVVNSLETRSRDTAASALTRTPAIARRQPGYWTPGKRLAIATSAAIAAVWGLFRGGATGLALVSVGTAGLARSASNRSIRELTGIGGPSREIHLRKTLTIHAPVEDVFRVLTDFESYPRFLRHVESVQRLDENRWHVVLAGILGRKVEFDGVVLQTVPNELISWTSAENAQVELTGSARFERMGPNETRVTIRTSYRPATALLRHEIAAVFHAGAKHELDEDMLRLQSLIEQGKATGRERQVAIEELRH